MSLIYLINLRDKNLGKQCFKCNIGIHLFPRFNLNPTKAFQAVLVSDLVPKKTLDKLHFLALHSNICENILFYLLKRRRTPKELLQIFNFSWKEQIIPAEKKYA